MYPNPSSMVPLVIGSTDGPTLTAAAAASCIPVANRLILPNNYWSIGKKWLVHMSGRISCVVTTPGTARLDFRTGPSGTIVAFDSGAMNLNIVAKTTVPWMFECRLTCRAIGMRSPLVSITLLKSSTAKCAPASTNKRPPPVGVAGADHRRHDSQPSNRPVALSRKSVRFRNAAVYKKTA